MGNTEHSHGRTEAIEKTLKEIRTRKKKGNENGIETYVCADANVLV